MSGFYGQDYDDDGNLIPRGEDLDGAALLDEVHAAYTRYVIFPSPEAADALTLYTAATHDQPAWEHASRLVIKSPIKRCGKTRAQEVARELVHKALPTTNISRPRWPGRSARTIRRRSSSMRPTRYGARRTSGLRVPRICAAS